MERNSLIAIAVCGVLVSVMIFSAYYIGSKSSYATGFYEGNKTGYTTGPEYHMLNYELGYIDGNQSGYQIGYNAALKALNVTAGVK